MRHGSHAAAVSATASMGPAIFACLIRQPEGGSTNAEMATMLPGLHVGGAIALYVVLVLAYLILPFFRREVYTINLVSLLIFSVLGAFATRSVTDEHNMVAAMEAAFVLEPFPYFQRIHTYEHVWQWLDGPFQSAIFETDIDASGSIMTFNRLVGAIRLSQQTVEPERCSEGRDGRVVKICYPDTGDDYPVRNAEDVEDVKPIEVNGSLRLTRESVNSTLTTLREDKHWFDASTRALIVSLSTYNYNCNLFVSLTFFLNQHPSGAVDPWCARVLDATLLPPPQLASSVRAPQVRDLSRADRPSMGSADQRSLHTRGLLDRHHPRRASHPKVVHLVRHQVQAAAHARGRPGDRRARRAAGSSRRGTPPLLLPLACTQAARRQPHRVRAPRP